MIKQVLITLTGFILFCVETSGDEAFGLQYHQEYGTEQERDEETFGIGITSELKFCDGLYCRIGLGFSEIRSNQMLNNKGDTSVTPVYLFFHITGDTIIAPFVELGADFNTLFLGEKYKNYGSAYFSAGLNASLLENVSINAYFKQYRIANGFDNTDNNYPHDEEIEDKRQRVNVTGASLTVFFE